MNNWPHTARAWARLKLTIAERLVSSVMEETNDNRTALRNLQAVAAIDEIRQLKEQYFPKPEDPDDDFRNAAGA